MKLKQSVRLYPVVVNVGICSFYALQKTERGYMKTILVECPNSRGRKTRFKHTAPIDIKGEVGERLLTEYLNNALRFWKYKPAVYSRYEDAEESLAQKLKIDHDKVSFHPFKGS